MYHSEYEGIFEAKFGFAQGDEDSPFGYIIVKDMFLSYASSLSNLDPPTLNGLPIPINGFADDIRAYSTAIQGATNMVSALELFLLLFRGSLNINKCEWSAATWRYNHHLGQVELVNSNDTLTTSKGDVIAYRSISTAVRDLGFKTSIDLRNTSQTEILQEKSEGLAARIAELNEMSTSSAFLLDRTIQVPSTSYACSFLPVTEKSLHKLDQVAQQILRRRVRVPAKFPSTLLHAFPLGLGRLGLFHRVLLDRWAILASHLCCAVDSLLYQIAINLLNQIRLSIGLPTVCDTPVGDQLLPSFKEITDYNLDLRFRWLTPLTQWLPQFNIQLIQGPATIADQDLDYLLGHRLNIPRAKNLFLAHLSPSSYIYSYSDGSHIPESDICAFSYRIVIFDERIEQYHPRGVTVHHGAQAICLTTDTANACIAELLGALASLQALHRLHRLDNSSVVGTASKHKFKTPYQWLRTAGQPLWRCYRPFISSIPSKLRLLIMWIRGDPELRNQDPNSWSLHEFHNSEVDKAATHAATRACRNAPQPFNLLSLCPGPTWRVRYKPDQVFYPILGQLRPSLRSILGRSSLFEYLIQRSNNTSQADPRPHAAKPLSLTPQHIHLRSVISAWKMLGARRRGRFTRLWSGWIPTNMRQSFTNKNTRPECPLCTRNNNGTSIPVETLHHLLHSCPSLQPERTKGPALLSDGLQTAYPRLSPSQARGISRNYWDHLLETRAGTPTIAITQWVSRPVEQALGNKSFTTTSSRSSSYYTLTSAGKLWNYRNSLVHSKQPTHTVLCGSQFNQFCLVNLEER